MAWTWRKRFTLLPGLRLNFGKKGVSTTVGPRGASITMGPNGTYLNTSIPGTGMYNRQKIGGQKTMSENNNVRSKTSWLSVISFVLWALLIFGICLGFKISTLIGVIFVGVALLTHVIVNKVANKTTKATTSETPKEQLTDDAYFSQISKVADDLYADYETILNMPQIDSMISSAGVSLIINGNPVTDVKQKLHFMFLIDATRCYMGLGHLFDLNSKEGLGMFYLITRLNGYPKHKSLADFAPARAFLLDESAAHIKGAKAYIDTATVPDETFLISRLLASNDFELYRKFLVDMYRFASLTAKADNEVTDEEAAWLSNIMKLQDAKRQEAAPKEQEDSAGTHLTVYESGSVDLTRLDPIFEDVARYVVAKQEGSTSRLQRAFELGYKRAAKITDQLEAAGIVGPNKGYKGRDVLIQDFSQLEQKLEKIRVSGIPSNSNISREVQDTTTMPAKLKIQNPAKMLDELIGLNSVKQEVESLTNFIKIQQTRQAKGLKTSAVSYHCVFTGNPGTGKTTVARILAKIYKELGVVKKGHLIETDRAGLVAEYVGQTAVKTNKIIDSALDGVLFIDEAYSLIGGGESDFGKEAIATLLKRMEDDRDRLIVILAGYTRNMKDFIDSNPGLQSRFNRYIEFPDYSAEELLQIFEVNMKKYDYHFGEGSKDALLQYLNKEIANKDANFGNGRLVRNVFEKTLERQANRLSREVNLTTEILSQIEVEDLPIE